MAMGNPRDQGVSHPHPPPRPSRGGDGGGLLSWPAEPSVAQALFEVFDSDLEGGDVLLQFRQIALQDLPARPLTGESRLDAAERLRDREVFLLEPVEPPVNLVEVAEHLAPQLGNLVLRPVDPPIQDRKSVV